MASNSVSEKHVLTKEFVRYNFIDSLRGWAILGVLLAHVSIVGNTDYPAWLTNLTYLHVGPRGVQLFFIISALTLCLSWTKRKDKEKSPLRNFYIRRFFRIAPLFYLFILYFLFSKDYFNGNPEHITSANIFATYLFVNGLVPAWINNIVFGGWTIAVEMMFYLIFPYLVNKIASFKVAIVLTAVSMVLAQGLRLALNSTLFFSTTYPTYTFEFFPTQFPVFLIGIALFWALKSGLNLNNKKFILYAFVILTSLLILQFLFGYPIIAGHYIYSIFFGVVAFLLFFRPVKLLVNPLTMHLGKVSYSMYLCHFPVLLLMQKYGLVNFLPKYPELNFLVQFALLLLISASIATVLYHFIERPGQLLGKKLIDYYEKKETVDMNAI